MLFKSFVFSVLNGWKFFGLNFVELFSLVDFLFDLLLLALFSEVVDGVWMMTDWVPFWWRNCSILASSYFYFCYWMALSSRFFELIYWISFMVWTFLSLRCLYLSCYSLMAFSALSLTNSPSSSSSLISWMYFFLTSLCCFRIPFSNSFNFFFSTYFFFFSSSSFFLICSWNYLKTYQGLLVIILLALFF